MLKLGAHVSAAGGPHCIFQRGQDLGCEALQLFTRPPSRWNAPPLKPEHIKAFHDIRESLPQQSVIAHDIYLNNLASDDPQLRARSIESTIEEIERCHLLGLDGLVLHLGSNRNSSSAGLGLYSSAIKEILERTEQTPIPILLETCAGQGFCLGYALEHLKEVIDFNKSHPRLGVCVDTCHLFAAGYDLRTQTDYHSFWTTFEQLIGIDKLRAFHLNDSKKPLASRVDRHDHIGKGEIGDSTFSLLLQDSRFKGLPAIIETPELETMAQVNLDRLRSLRSPSPRKRKPRS